MLGFSHAVDVGRKTSGFSRTQGETAAKELWSQASWLSRFRVRLNSLAGASTLYKDGDQAAERGMWVFGLYAVRSQSS